MPGVTRRVPFTIYYFRVAVRKEELNFEGVLQELLEGRQGGAFPTVTASGDQLRLGNLVRTGGTYRGDLHHIDMAQTATKGGPGGRVEPVRLTAEEGILDAAAFLYDPRLRVLAVERRSQGATLGRFAGYFEKLEHVGCGVELHPVVRRDVDDAYDALSRTTKLTLRIAGGVKTGPGSGAPKAVSSIFDVAEQLGAPEIEVTVTVAHKYRSQSLIIDRVKRAVDHLRRQDASGAAEISTLKITGTDGEGKATQTLDLIEERVRDQITLEPNEQRVIPYEARLAALTASFDDKQKLLDGMFGAE